MKVEGDRTAKGEARPRSWPDRLGHSLVTSPWVSMVTSVYGVYLIFHCHGASRVLWVITTLLCVLSFFDRAHTRGWYKR